MPDPTPAAIVFPPRGDKFWNDFDDPWLTSIILPGLVLDGIRGNFVQAFTGHPADHSDRMKYVLAVLYHNISTLLTRAEALALFDAIPLKETKDEIPF